MNQSEIYLITLDSHAGICVIAQYGCECWLTATEATLTESNKDKEWSGILLASLNWITFPMKTSGNDLVLYWSWIKYKFSTSLNIHHGRSQHDVVEVNTIIKMGCTLEVIIQRDTQRSDELIHYKRSKEGKPSSWHGPRQLNGDSGSCN